MSKCKATVVKKKTQCTREATIEGYCKQHAKIAGIEVPKEMGTVIPDYVGEFQECNSKGHHTISSYPKDQVPKILFKKKDEDFSLKNCKDCRDYTKKCDDRMLIKRKNKAEEMKNSNGMFGFCIASEHETVSGSPYKRDEVPIEGLRKNPNDESSMLYNNCNYCRDYITGTTKIRVNKKKTIAVNTNKFYCSNCNKTKELTEQAPNLDGTMSILCHPCKDIERERSVNIRCHYNESKSNQIYQSEVSCQKCECIFLHNPENEFAIITLQTYNIEGARYVDYNNITYIIKQFFDLFKDMLELRIIQLDHLTEEEQIERNIISDSESYIPKIRNVSKMSSKETINSEAKKCQNLCARCHVKETILREKGIAYNSRSHSERLKLEYVNELKRHGCEICKYSDPNFMRFFDMDHIDKQTKIKEISRMIKDNNYSIEDVIDECKKCRVLCRHCHIIHTAQQRSIEGHF